MAHTLPGSTFEIKWDGGQKELETQVTWPERIMFLESSEETAAGEGTSDYTLVARFPQ
jgi:hypothetical protein